MKKKQTIARLTKASADDIAKNLRRGVGEVRAIKIASGLAKSLAESSVADINTEFFDVKSVQKGARIWTQVHNILQKRGGYTILELCVSLTILASLCAMGAALYVTTHFAHRFW